MAEAGDHKGNIQNAVLLEEHDGLLNAKKVSMVSAATLYAVVNTGAAGAGNTTVEQGTSPWVTSQAGNVTIDSIAAAWPDPKTYIGLVTITGSLAPAAGNVTLDPGSQTGLVGNVTIDSQVAWPDPKGYIGLVTITGSLAAAAGNVTLDPGSQTGIVGNVTLSDPKGFIGLVTVVGSLSAAAGNVTLDPGSLTGIIGNVTVEQGTNPWVVDATGQGDLPVTLDGEVVATTFSGNVTIDSGNISVVGNVTVEQGDNPWQTAQVGNVTIDSGNISLTGNVTIDSGNVSVLGNVTVEQGDNPWVTSNIGNVTVEQGDNPWNVATIGNVTLSDPKTFIGLVTSVSAPAVRSDATVAAINTATSGDNGIVPAPGASNQIAVWHYFMVSDGTVDARWEDGAGGTAFTGQVPMQAREGWVATAPDSTIPLMTFKANTTVSLELSAAVNVHGSVVYTVESE